jgi:hypothetical protein
MTLQDGLIELGLGCATERDAVSAGLIGHLAIDNITLPTDWVDRSRVVVAWEGVSAEGINLSDHSGLAAQVKF